MMPKATRSLTIAIALGLCLALPLGVVAQSDATDEPTLPVLDGLAWHRSIDLAGADMQATLPEAEVAEWGTLADGTGATIEELEYTYDAAFDPSRLPELGGIATVRVAGAGTDALNDAVVADVVAQVVATGSAAPEPQAATVGGKDVTLVGLPAAMGHEDATIYARGDTAWVILLPEHLAALALEQLP